MSPSIFSEVRQDKERVLVGLVWILWRVASLRSEGKLGDAVVELLTGLTRLHRLVLGGRRDFFRDGRSHVVRALTLRPFRLWHLVAWGVHA